MTRFDVRESLAMTGRGPWVVGELRAGRPVVGDVLVVAHTGARVQVAQVGDDGTRLLLDAPVPAGAVLVGAEDPVPDVPPPAGVPPGPVRYEVRFAGTGTVLGLAIHPDDARHVPEGAVLVAREGEP